MDEYLARLLGWLDPEPSNDGITWSREGLIDPEAFDDRQLQSVRTMARHLYYHNEFAISAHRTRANYIIGPGLTYEPVDAIPEQPASPQDKASFKRWLDAVAEVNDLPNMEQESLLRYDREGDTFIRVFDGEDRIPEFRFVEPESIRSGPRPEKNEFAGILFDQVDKQKVLGYRVWDGDQSELVKESEIVHLKANVTSKAKRGIPLFYSVFEGLVEAKDLLRGMTKAAKARAKIALLIKIAGLNRETAKGLIARLTAPQSEEGPLPDTSATPVEQLPYGSAVRINANDSWDFPAAQLGATDYVEVLQARLRAVGCAVNMSEWMFTGLADQKYSNSEVVEAPTRKSFADVQGDFCKRFGSGRYRRQASVMWRALKRSVDLGHVPATWLTSMRIQCLGPSLEVREPDKEAQVNSTYIKDKVLSRKTVRQTLGKDNEQEEAQIQKEKALYPDASPTPIGQPGSPQSGGDPGSNGNLLNTVGGATSLTSLQTAFYKGEMPREAAVQTATTVYGISPDKAELLFPLRPVTPIAASVNPAATAPTV
jgi:capsid protein